MCGFGCVCSRIYLFCNFYMYIWGVVLVLLFFLFIYCSGFLGDTIHSQSGIFLHC